MSAAVEELVGELTSRFPPHQLLDVASIVYSEYWEAKPTSAGFKAKLTVIKEYYCCQRRSSNSSKVPPMLDGALLDAQAQLFASTMTQLAAQQRLNWLVRKRSSSGRQRRQTWTCPPPSVITVCCLMTHPHHGYGKASATAWP